ncbi:LysM peptidoglycan-binding domain-containing protein [Candidatus Saccharibacteria bacterium]|nr:LysM peptidoglycan-binding domain-containing protein [Candidatus Saccharibacteria bacterium]MBR0423937.1 LysM peptidoglycan-binding domain-containing protein [Candidatus Saccharibacteria bacterium]
MTKKTNQTFENLKKIGPYFLAAALTLMTVILGSIGKSQSGTTLNLDTFAKADYDISVDQLSEMYVVADLSDALGLASASDVASNYVITTSMYDAGQTATGKLEKPAITNIVVSRGVIEYTVQEGDTMESIAAKYGLTTDQIRWSNNLKTTAVTPGNVLVLPSVPGIVYTVKSGDTIESIASKYGSTAAEITALNDLEVSGIKEGDKIVIKNGSLPETERPEYVAPKPVTYRTTYSYSYLGNTSERQNITVLGRIYGLGGPYGAGQCTQWAWSKRQDLPSNLGNANTWAARAAAAGYVVNRTPSAGAIFQTSSGWYGHVGYVEAVNPDGSITVTEMNYGYSPYLVIRATIPASSVGNFNYIH